MDIGPMVSTQACKVQKSHLDIAAIPYTIKVYACHMACSATSTSLIALLPRAHMRRRGKAVILYDCKSSGKI